MSCYGDIFRKMVLLCQDVGMAPGEYVFIFFFQLVGDPAVGAYTWERGDELDMVTYFLRKKFSFFVFDLSLQF